MPFRMALETSVAAGEKASPFPQPTTMMNISVNPAVVCLFRIPKQTYRIPAFFQETECFSIAGMM